jgi:hypothetical protein
MDVRTIGMGSTDCSIYLGQRMPPGLAQRSTGQECPSIESRIWPWLSVSDMPWL